MAKLVLNDIVSGYAANELYNANNDATETALENTLSRDGTTPNEMEADLDMNSNQILNLPSPNTDLSAARWIDIKNGVSTTDTIMPSVVGNEGKPVTSNGVDFIFGDIDTVNINYDIGAVTRTLDSKLGDFVSVLDFGAVGDGATDDVVELQAALDSGNPVIAFNGGKTYVITSLLTIPTNTTVVVEAGSTIKNTTTGDNGIFSIAAGATDITITGGGRLIGPYESTTPVPVSAYPASNGAIRVLGTGASPVERLNIKGITIKGWGTYGVFAESAIDSCVSNNHIEKIGRDGIRSYGCIDSRFNFNRIHNIAPGISGTPPNLNVYGITFTRNPAAQPATNPASQRCTAIGNIVTDCLTWKALDTHGGKDLIFSDNIVEGAYIGIGVDEGDTSGFPGDSPPEGIHIVNNVVKRGSGNSDGAGIAVSSDSATTPGKEIIVKGNRVDDFGGATQGGAVAVNFVDGMVIESNYINESERAAITIKTESYNVRIADNIIRDLTGTVVAAITIEDGARSVDISSGTFTRTAGSFTAFSFAALSSGTISLGNSFLYRGAITKFAASARGRIDTGTFMSTPKAWTRVTSAGALSGSSFGVASASQTSTGVYRVTLDEALVTNNDVIPMITLDTNVAAHSATLIASTTQIDVYTFDSAGTATNFNFKIAVFGR